MAANLSMKNNTTTNTITKQNNFEENLTHINAKCSDTDVLSTSEDLTQKSLAKTEQVIAIGEDNFVYTKDIARQYKEIHNLDQFSDEQVVKIMMMQTASPATKRQRLYNKYIKDLPVTIPFNTELLCAICRDLQDNDLLNTNELLLYEYMKQYWTCIKNENAEFIKTTYDDYGFVSRMNIYSFESMIKNFRFLKQFDTKELKVFEQMFLYKIQQYQQYDTKVWKPSLPVHENEFNTFVVPNYRKYLKVDCQLDTNYIEIVNNHIYEVLCNSDKKAFELLTNWFAYQIQNQSYENIPIVPCFIGEVQGTGKSMIIEFWGNKIIGDGNYGKCCSIEDLTAQFNAKISKKLFIYLNDIGTYGKGHRVWNLLKSFFGNKDKKTVEEKFKESYDAEHVANYIIDSNNRDCLKIEKDNRRYWVLEVTKKKDGNYYQELANALQDTNTAIHWVKWLNTKDLSDYNPNNFEQSVVITKLYREMQSINVPMLIKYIKYVVDTDGFKDFKYKKVSKLGSFRIAKQAFLCELENYAINIEKDSKYNLTKDNATIVTNELNRYELAVLKKSDGYPSFIFQSYENIKQTLERYNFWYDDFHGETALND